LEAEKNHRTEGVFGSGGDACEGVMQDKRRRKLTIVAVKIFKGTKMARSIVVVRKVKGDLVGLTGADLDCIAKARAFAKNLHREIYRCLSIICELDAACDVLAQDDRDNFNQLRKNWESWHAADLKPE
jgi:hypothetical protein